jgi:hypothetical protein
MRPIIPARLLNKHVADVTQPVAVGRRLVISHHAVKHERIVKTAFVYFSLEG